MSALSIELPEDIEERLQELAQRTGRSEASYYVLEAVVEHLGDLEDIYIA